MLATRAMIWQVGTFLKKCFIINIFLECFIKARSLENLGEFSQIINNKHSLREAGTEISSLKIALYLITHELYYLI